LCTVIHRRQNRTVWRALTRASPKYDGPFVHGEHTPEDSRIPRGAPRAPRGPRAFFAGKRDLDTEISALVRLAGVTVAWRGTPDLDDWVAYIVNGTRSKKLILADHSSERKVKSLLSRLQALPRKEIEKLAKS
jgi:hypothetical protein